MPIRQILLLFSLVSSLLTVGCSPQGNKNPFSADSGLSLYEPEKMKILADSGKLTLEERMLTLTSLRDAMKNGYVGYNLKKQLIGISGDEIFAQCFAAEQAATEDSYVQNFFDRLNQCVALFQDSHLFLKKFLTSEQVISPIVESVWLNNEVYISLARPQMIDALVKSGELDAGAAHFLAKGSKILAIDGMKPEEAFAETASIMSESTKLAVRKSAALLFFNRYSLYPQKPTVELTLEDPTGQVVSLSVPWVSYSKKDNIETPYLLKERNIKNISTYGDPTDLRKNSGQDLDTAIYKDILNKSSYQYNDEEFLVTGEVLVGSEQVCYFRLTTFDLETEKGLFMVKDQNKEKVNLATVFSKFLTDCNGKKLIADMRVNGGGNSALQELLASFFERKSNPVYGARAYRINKGNTNVYSAMLSELDKATPRAQSVTMMNSIVDAIANKQEMTTWTLSKIRRNRTDVYTAGKILLLVSPACVSACENFSNRIAMNPNVVVIGEPTAGTGFGYSSNGDNESLWRDPLNSFRMKIPNHTFGSSTVMDDGTLVQDAAAIAGRISFDKVKILENNAIQPHLKYSYQPEDLNDFAGYKKFIEQNL